MLLDASAVLALMYDEPGAKNVRAALVDSAVSTVNLSEVVGKLAEDGLTAVEIGEAVALGFEVIPFDETLALRAGELSPKTRPFGLSLGDRACLATAIQHGLPVLTADKTWRKLDLGVKVHLIR